MGGGAAQPAPAPAPAAGAAAAGAGENAVPGFEPTEEQMAQFIQVTGAVRSVATGKPQHPHPILTYSSPHPHLILT